MSSLRRKLKALFQVLGTLLFLMTSLFCLFFPAWSISYNVALIPNEDRVVLAHFFRSLIQTFGAGYVLYGSKPMCITGYSNPLKQYFDKKKNSTLSFWTGSSASFNEHNLLMEAGLAMWKKYAFLFPRKNFFLVDYEESDGTVSIVLINKKMFLKKIKDELPEFERFYNKKITPEVIFHQLVTRDPLFFKMIYKHQDMLGILLGYGTNNAKLFERKVELWVALDKIKPHKLNYKTKPASGFASLAKELAFLDLKTQFPEEKISNLNFIPRVGFVANMQDPETQNLKKRYKTEQKKITQKYSTGDFLQTTLAALSR